MPGAWRELLEAERTVALEREGELRRVKQREYAEQQLRVEAEDRLVGIDRASRSDIGELRRRLGASEHEAKELAERLEVHPATARRGRTGLGRRARRGAPRRKASCNARLGELERRASEMSLGLEAERSARAGSERLLETMRDGHRRMEAIVEDVRDVVGRLSGALAARPRRRRRTRAPRRRRPPRRSRHRLPPRRRRARGAARRGAVGSARRMRAQPHRRRDRGPAAEPAALREAARSGSRRCAPWRSRRRPRQAPAEQARGEEMAQALAAAVERLRARAEAAPAPSVPSAPPERPRAADASASLSDRARRERRETRATGRRRGAAPRSTAEPGAAAGRAPREETPARAPARAAGRPSHKHSLSLIGRLRNRRKQRRGR